MKSKLTFLLLLLPLTAGLQAEESAPTSNRPGTSETSARPTAAIVLAAQVKEIASSTTLSSKDQAKKIAEAVRLAVTTATAGIKDPAARLKLAMELVTTAAKAAPQFAATITSAVSDIPSIANIEGVAGRIQAAVAEGIAAADEAAGSGNPAAQGSRPAANPEFGGPNKSETVVSPSK